MVRKVETLIYACHKWEVEELDDLMSEQRKGWLRAIGCTGYEVAGTIFVRVQTADILLMLAAVEYLVGQGFVNIGWLESEMGENHDA